MAINLSASIEPSKAIVQETGEVTVNLQVTELDPLAPEGYVQAIVDFGNGEILALPKARGKIQKTLTRLYSPGLYTVVISATNFAWPKPATDKVTLQLELIDARAQSLDIPYASGPTLPADSGNPSRDDWMFNISSNVQVLISSVKAALLTSIGERMMEPSYGNNIKALLFSHYNESDVSQEVRRAIAENEPRVDVLGTEVVFDNCEKAATLDVSCISKIDRRTFQLRLSYNA